MRSKRSRPAESDEAQASSESSALGNVIPLVGRDATEGTVSRSQKRRLQRKRRKLRNTLAQAVTGDLTLQAATEGNGSTTPPSAAAQVVTQVAAAKAKLTPSSFPSAAAPSQAATESGTSILQAAPDAEESKPAAVVVKATSAAVESKVSDVAEGVVGSTLAAAPPPAAAEEFEDPEEPELAGNGPPLEAANSRFGRDGKTHWSRDEKGNLIVCGWGTPPPRPAEDAVLPAIMVPPNTRRVDTYAWTNRPIRPHQDECNDPPVDEPAAEPEVEGDDPPPELLAAAEDPEDPEDPPAPFKYSTAAERDEQRLFIGYNDDPVKVWHKLREYTLGIHGPDVPLLESRMIAEYYKIRPRQRFRPPPHPSTVPHTRGTYEFEDHFMQCDDDRHKSFSRIQRMLREHHMRYEQGGMCDWSY